MVEAIIPDSFTSRKHVYEYILDSIGNLADKDEGNNWVVISANLSSLIYHSLNNYGVKVNWAGVYICQQSYDQLDLGPFQGELACQTIKLGKGVCGKAAETKSTIVVEDVEKFPGHIACSSKTKSEIVVPIISNGRAIGVIDLDGLDIASFGEADKLGLERIAEFIAKACHWPQISIKT